MYRVWCLCLILINLPDCPTYELLQVFFMYRICSLCLIPVDMPVCPAYELLQVLHFSLYIPLEFILFWFILSLSCLYMVFVAGKAMFILVCLNILVILCISAL